MSLYHEEKKEQGTRQLRLLLQELPPFLQVFFRGIAQSTSIQTRIGYAYDLKVFFSYLYEEHPAFVGRTPMEVRAADLGAVKASDIDCFLEYVTLYDTQDPQNPEQSRTLKNDEKGKARKLAAIRSLYKFFYKKEILTVNPTTLVENPKIHTKQIVRLQADEVAELLDGVETGSGLTEHQKRYHVHTKERDLAIVTLLLGTGMRVSECVGINLTDLDFRTGGVLVTRKGGNQVMLYFGEEVQEALENYLLLRKQQTIRFPEEEALFLSSQGKRISVRAVQNLVKKYAAPVVPTKTISPHKLRSTYGTALYQETNDIYLVADVLGHADVNTTRKHYAEQEEYRRKNAAKYVKLRKD